MDAVACVLNSFDQLGNENINAGDAIHRSRGITLFFERLGVVFQFFDALSNGISFQLDLFLDLVRCCQIGRPRSCNCLQRRTRFFFVMCTLVDPLV